MRLPFVLLPNPECYTKKYAVVWRQQDRPAEASFAVRASVMKPFGRIAYRQTAVTAPVERHRFLMCLREGKHVNGFAKYAVSC